VELVTVAVELWVLLGELVELRVLLAVPEADAEADTDGASELDGLPVRVAMAVRDALMLPVTVLL